MPRPRIGISGGLEHARWGVWDREAHLSPRSYSDRVHEAGGLVLVLPVDPDPEGAAAEYLDLVDGLILTGGVDVDPKSYGARRDPHTDPKTRPERDAAEIALCRAAIERDMPVLGICRGMQVMNVALGGTLIQHLPDSVGHGNHRRMLGSFDDADHDVRVAEGSLGARVIGELLHNTYSHHHQGVDRLGEGLVATGWATIDDLVEVVELPGKAFVLGVQWHPEVDEKSPVVGALVEAASSVLRA